MSDERARHAQVVLARRARFVAAALAATGFGGAGCSPCLSVEPGPDTGTVDAGADGVSDASDASDTGPAVCLSTDAMVDTGVDGAADAPTDGPPDAPTDTPTEGGSG